jgi:glycosyltransferase 2 family protein
MVRAKSAIVKRWVAPSVIVLATLLSIALLYRTLSRYDFEVLAQLVMAVPLARLALAISFAAASYFCLGLNDWLALSYARHPLPYPTAALTSFVAVSLGHSVGFAALSSGAIRYRFYSRSGLGAEEIAKIVAFCGATILVGMMVLGDIAIFARPDLVEKITGITGDEAFALGVLLALLLIGYLALSMLNLQPLRLFGWSIEMPRRWLAIGQMLVGTANFIFVAACLYSATSATAEISYFDVLAAFVLANTATMITHTPGGLGVIETVVLLVLHRPKLIGAVLVFRFAYFLLPLLAGGVAWIVSETYRRRKPARNAVCSAHDRSPPRSEQGGDPHGAARVQKPGSKYQMRGASS